MFIIFSDPEPFDWYQRYEHIKKFLALDYLRGNSFQSRELIDLKHTIPFPSKDSCRVLIIGCGTSRLGEDMLVDGWNGGIYQIDYSTVVIDRMIARYDDNFYKKLEASMDYRDGEKPDSCDDSVHFQGKKIVTKMSFQCLDVTKRLPFDDSFFDLIICKGSTFNAKI